MIFIVLLILILFTVSKALPHDDEEIIVKTCCDLPLRENNITWCDGMYSLSENVHFVYGDLKCPEGESLSNGSVDLARIVDGDTSSGFYPHYFLKYDERFYSTQDYCLSRFLIILLKNFQTDFCKSSIYETILI